MYTKDGTIDFGEFPSMFWDKKYEEDEDALNAFNQHISDFMLFGYGSGSNSHKKDDSLEDIFKGDTKKLNDLYKEVLMTYGAPGSSTLKDYDFFQTNYQSMNGLLIKIPFKLTTHNVSQWVVDLKIGKSAKMAAAMIRNKAAKALSQEEGQDYSFMENQEEYIPSTVDELLSTMNAPQEQEYVLTRLLMNLEYRKKVSDELLKANKEHFYCGKMFGYIDYDDGEPVIKHVSRKNFNYISSVPVTDMDDPNIIAWGVKSYISLENALRKYGKDLAGAPGADYLKETVAKLRGTGTGKFKYDPRKYQGGRYARTAYNSYDYEPIPGIMEEDWINGTAYQPSFYRMSANGVFGYNCSILEHKFWYRVTKTVRAKLLINGKNPTDKQWSQWKNKRHTFEEGAIRYAPVDDDYKAKGSERLAEYSIEELRQAIRLGHCVFIRSKKYPFQTRYEKNISQVMPPCFGLISEEKSPVEIGKEFAVFYNSFMLKAAELRNIAGADEVLLIDEAQMSMGQLASMLHSGQHTGTAHFNSAIIQDKSNPLAARHLTKTELSPRVDKILKYFEAASLIKGFYDNMIGKLGEPSPYDSAEKVNQMLQQSSLLTQMYFKEDYNFRQRAVQRWADIVKQYYGQEDRKMSVLTGRSEYEVLNITKDLANADYETYYDTGIKALEDKNFVMGMAEKAVSAGSLGFIDLIKIYFSDNIQESLALIQMAMNQLKQDNAAQQQAQIEALNQKTQMDAQAKQIPLAVEDKRSATAIQVAEIRANSQQAGLDHKGDAQDIEAQNRREEAMLQAELEQQKQQQVQQGDMEKLIVDSEVNKKPEPAKK